MTTLTLDFETFYGSGFSLTNLATAEYVGDEKFAVMGVGLAVDDGPVEFFFEEDLTRFRELLDSLPPDVTLVCHNTLFDGYILHKVFNWYPARYACTQSMSRGMFPNQSASLDNLTKRLWPKDPSMHKGKELVQFRNKRHLTEEEKVIYKRYCSQDVAITRAAYNLMLPHYPPTELDLIDLTCRMFCQPVAKLDVELLERALVEMEAERADIIRGGGVSETVLSSNTQFVEYLRDKHGIEVPKKVSLTTGKETEALSKNDIAFNELQAQHPELEHIWNARIAAKSVGEITRCKRFLSVAQASGGELAAPLIYYAAHTGRYGGGDKMNLQNLPRGSTLRRAIIAPQGQVVVALDSSNIEARMLAWEAGHEELLTDFRNKIDIYLKFASNHIYKRPLTKKENPVERHVGKVATLGLGYGMGPDKFQDTLAIGAMGPPVYLTREEAAAIVYTYRSVNAPVVNLWSRADAALTAMLQGESWEVLPKSDCLKTMRNMMVMPNGMALQYPALTVSYDDRNRPQFEYYNGKYMSKIYGGKGVENITQALARIVLFWQMLEIAKHIKPYGGRVVLNVHDEIVFTLPAMGAYKAGVDSKGKDIWEKSGELNAIVERCMTIMRTPPPWCPDLPLDCEGGYDYCYSK